MGDGNGTAALLRLLVRTNLLTQEVAQAAEAQLGTLQKGQTVIDWLSEKGHIREETLAKSLAQHMQLPFADLPATALDPAVSKLLREELAVQHHVVPLRLVGQILTVAMANPVDHGTIRAIEFATGKRIQAEVATQTAVRDALDHLYHLDQALEAYLKEIPEEGDLPIEEQVGQATTDIRSLMRETNLAPVVKLLNSVLREAVRAGASDIHIEGGSSGLRVRYRIDGLLEESMRLPKWVQDPLIARCKVLARLDITERRVPQDGRIQVRYGDSTVDLRVSSLPTQYGEKVTMRILDPRTAPGNLEKFSFSDCELSWIRQNIKRPEGIILVTGPTGSGKTTTLYGMIAEIVSPTRNIITIENPIEYQMDGVNQVEINEKQGLTFAGTLRSILRQDPDVILVGEIRDSETAEIALRAAQTGHLVLSTLHTNDAVCTITRLLDLGVAPYMLASALNLIVAQRLLRRVCSHCAEPYDPDLAGLRRLDIDPACEQFRRGHGCKQCRKSGYAGRVGVFEVLPVTTRMARLIEKRAPESALRIQARADGIAFLATSVAQRVNSGLTTVEEALRVVDVGLQTSRCPSCDRTVEDTFAVCPHCATILRRRCNGCGAQIEDDWQVCPHCTVPVKPPAVVPSGPQWTVPPPEPGRSPAPSTYRALVVDDHPDMRRIITFTLENSGMPISATAVESGAEALESAETNPPDLVLLDIMMPGMDGFAVCEQLRKNVRTAFIPILMLTARDDAASRARGFLAGTDDYVAKPFARAELVARVRRILERTYGSIASAPVLTHGAHASRPDGEHDISLQ
jgi:type IV pilus assembly protein PilB